MAARSINQVNIGITLAHTLDALRREAAPTPIRTVKTINPAIELWNLVIESMNIIIQHRNCGISAFSEWPPDHRPFYNCCVVRGEVHDVGLVKLQFREYIATLHAYLWV
jgi:hypothetical protein